MEKIYKKVFKTSYSIASLFFIFSLFGLISIYEEAYKSYLLTVACFAIFLILGVILLLFGIHYHIKYKELMQDALKKD